jgi:hypothetical protein
MFPGKKLMIGETGWPSAGPPHGAAVPSAENQARYFTDFLAWTKRQPDQVQYYYFDAFDEAWKNGEQSSVRTGDFTVKTARASPRFAVCFLPPRRERCESEPTVTSTSAVCPPASASA